MEVLARAFSVASVSILKPSLLAPCPISPVLKLEFLHLQPVLDSPLAEEFPPQSFAADTLHAGVLRNSPEDALQDPQPAPVPNVAESKAVKILREPEAKHLALPLVKECVPMMHRCLAVEGPHGILG